MEGEKIPVAIGDCVIVFRWTSKWFYRDIVLTEGQFVCRVRVSLFHLHLHLGCVGVWVVVLGHFTCHGVCHAAFTCHGVCHAAFHMPWGVPCSISHAMGYAMQHFTCHGVCHAAFHMPWGVPCSISHAMGCAMQHFTCHGALHMKWGIHVNFELLFAFSLNGSVSSTADEYSPGLVGDLLLCYCMCPNPW